MIEISITKKEVNKINNKNNNEGGTTMKRGKKAIGYVCDIPIYGTDMVISKEDQRLRILKYAQNEGLNLIAIYEDNAFDKDFANRPGVRKCLDCQETFDMIIVERVWCLSRIRKELDPFLKKLDEKKVQLLSTSYLWDCVSQHVRHRYTGGPAEALKEKVRACAVGEETKTGNAAA
jgi:hypothetical protein